MGLRECALRRGEIDLRGEERKGVVNWSGVGAEKYYCLVQLGAWELLPGRSALTIAGHAARNPYHSAIEGGLGRQQVEHVTCQLLPWLRRRPVE